LVVLLAIAVGATYLATRSTDSKGSTPTRSTELVTVARRDLVQTASFDGTVDYANQRDIAATSLSSSSASGSSGSGGSASGSGVVTSVARVGAIVKRGGTLFSVNAEPTVLMYGAAPAYRTLRSGVADGPDIKQLQDNLKALGYMSSDVTSSESWNSATTTAVEAWEDALGLTEDGTVPLGRVVFAPDAVRIGAAATRGDSVTSTSTVVTITSTQRQVTVDLTSSDAAIVSVGQGVRVTLPSGAPVSGRVTSVGTVATADSSSSGNSTQGGAVNQAGGSSSTSDPTIAVTISLAQTNALGSLATAPVSVAFTQQRAKDALAVPTTALLTLADGTFAVEVSTGASSTKLVRVTPGLFAAGGFVAIEGDVKQGDKVVVPT
jgi:peptidoglycan hydrolase-like protein with peptidoglycan-binding domain